MRAERGLIQEIVLDSVVHERCLVSLCGGTHSAPSPPAVMVGNPSSTAVALPSPQARRRRTALPTIRAMRSSLSASRSTLSLQLAPAKSRHGGLVVCPLRHTDITSSSSATLLVRTGVAFAGACAVLRTSRTSRKLRSVAACRLFNAPPCFVDFSTAELRCRPIAARCRDVGPR